MSTATAGAKTKTKSKSKGKFTAKIEKQSEDVEMKSASSSDEDDGDSQADASSESEASDYDDLARARKLAQKAVGSKKRKTAEADEFASILTSILDQDARDEKAPIMAKDKTRENQIKEELLEYRARKALTAERKMHREKDRVIPTMENFDYERKLRKVATRGVIKLFNVVKAQQTELTEIEATQTTQTEKIAEMSKSKFISLLKTKTDAE
ncbi:hypothetical protein GGI05_007316 [Coemansia sp. RSA 2603]|nr:hypothetical protein GGI05_007316 [Coemansia sp. RSA 2603]